MGSTVLNTFSTAVAERFGILTPYKTPLVEANGTGGGFRIFCQKGPHRGPDAVNASRPLEENERRFCRDRGIVDLVKFKVGHDGVVLASQKLEKPLNLSLKDLFKLFAKVIFDGEKWIENPTKLWSDIDPSLPAEKIIILGPPPSSGTYSTLIDLILKPNCPQDQPKCVLIRTDGVYIPASEHENVVVQKILQNSSYYGVFSFSFLKHHKTELSPVSINGAEPTMESIANGDYLLSRPLLVYTFKDRLAVKPQLALFLQEFYSDRATGERGYLALKGLIPLSNAERKKYRKILDDYLKNGGG